MSEDQTTKRLNELRQAADLEREIANSTGAQLRLNQLNNQVLEQTKALREAIESGNEEDEQPQLRMLELMEKQRDAAQERLTLEEQALDIGKNFGERLIKTNTEALQHYIKSQSIISTSVGITTGFLEHFESFRKSAVMAVDKIYTTTKEQVRIYDRMAASFVGATGASRDFAETAYKTRDELGLLGISGEDAVKTMNTLYTGFNEFTELSKEAQAEIIVLTSEFDKIGGAGAAVAQVLTKDANMSLSETKENMLLVAGAADALGVTLQQMSADIQQTAELFAKMGSAGMDVFLDLSAAAKATGMSVGELYQITSQYDTFENAAAAAGRLNMVLGGNLLDTYSLLNAEENERVELLQEALRLSGRSFDDMDRYERREIADALNISLIEANKLFGTTREEIRQTAAQLLHAGMTQEELEQRTRDAATAMDKFTVLMGNLAIAVGPIVNGLNSIIDALLQLSKHIGATGAAIVGLLGYLAIMNLARKAVSFLTGKVSMLTGATGALRRGVAGAGNRLRDFSRATRGATGATGALRRGITGARNRFRGFGRAAQGAAGGMRTAGAAGSAGAAGVLKFGLATLMVGAGIAIAGFGLGYFVSQFRGMDPAQILSVAAAFVIFTLSIIGFAAAIAAMGFGAKIFAIGAGVLAGSIAAVALALKLIKKEKFDAISSLFSSMADLATASNSINLSAFTDFFNILRSTSLSEEELNNINAFKNTLHELGIIIKELPETVESADYFRNLNESLISLLNLEGFEGDLTRLSTMSSSIEDLANALEQLPEGVGNLQSLAVSLESISELNQVLQQLPGGVGNIQSLAASLELIKSLSQELTPGGGITATIQEIGTALDELPVNTEKFQSYSNIFNSLADLAQTSLQGGNIPALIREINSALEEFPDDTTKVMAFKTTADSLADLARISSTIEETQLENIKLIIDSISNSNGNENFERIANSIAALVEGRGGAETNPGAPIVIEIDGRVLGRWVDRRFKTAITRITN